MGKNNWKYCPCVCLANCDNRGVACETCFRKDKFKEKPDGKIDKVGTRASIVPGQISSVGSF